MANYITPLGLKRLQDEYLFLKKVERPKITDLVSWAASLGDRSENADYIVLLFEFSSIENSPKDLYTRMVLRLKLLALRRAA